MTFRRSECRAGRTGIGGNCCGIGTAWCAHPHHESTAGGGTERRTAVQEEVVARTWTQQQGPFAPRALPRFIATAGPSATFSPSTDFPALPVIRFPALWISPRDEEGFSSCLTCPCHRAVANAPPECLAASVSLRRCMLPPPQSWVRLLDPGEERSSK